MNDYRKITNSGCMHLPSYEHHLPFDVYNHSKNRIDISNRADTGHMPNISWTDILISIKIIWLFGLKPEAFLLNGTLYISMGVRFTCKIDKYFMLSNCPACMLIFLTKKSTLHALIRYIHVYSKTIESAIFAPPKMIEQGRTCKFYLFEQPYFKLLKNCLNMFKKWSK